MVRTASVGYMPRAVSPESITASVPSKMALATSVASARVGRDDEIIDSSICVAVMTGLLARLHFADDLLLHDRHALHRNLDAEIAARHHDAVGCSDDVVEIVERLVLFDLGDHGRRFAALGDEGFDALYVFGRSHERNRDVVDALIQAEGEKLEVLLGHRAEIERTVRIVDALRRAQIAAVFDDRVDFGGALVDDAQRDRTVLQVDAVADRDVCRQVAIAHAHSLARPGDVVDRQDESLPARERHRIHAVGEFSGAHFRTG